MQKENNTQQTAIAAFLTNHNPSEVQTQLFELNAWLAGSELFDVIHPSERQEHSFLLFELAELVKSLPSV